MAANAFEQLLSELTDEADRKVLSDLGTKYKEVKDGYLRQADFSREMNRMKDREKQIGQEMDKLERWNAWRAAHWVDDGSGGGKTKEQIEAEQKLADLDTELSALREAQEVGGMTFEEVQQFVDKEISKRNVVTKENLEKDYFPKMVERKFYDEDVAARITNTANGLGYLLHKTLPLEFKHKDEFGDIFKPDELVQYANENGFKDIEKAYDSWVAPRRAELSTKKMTEELAKAKEEGRLEALKEKGMAVNGKNPVDQGAPVMSHLQQRLLRKTDPEKALIPEDTTLGNNVVSNLVAEQYRKDAMEGTLLKG